MAALADDINTYTNRIPVATSPSKPVVNIQASLQHGEFTAMNKAMIGQALKNHIDQIDGDTCEVGDEEAFFVADLGEIYRQHLRWKMNLGRVKPHFAVKANPDPRVIRLLAALGCGFDCASKAEMELVLSMGVDPTRIIYAQPCKTKSHLRYAGSNNVKQLTFDNTDELYKIKQIYPGAELFLRIITDDSTSLCRLSMKFGAPMDTTKDLLELAAKLELNVVGVAFHVGSGASDPQAFTQAVKDASTVFAQGAQLGFKMHTLDVGGGFCSDSTFEPMAVVLRSALDAYFPQSVRIIAEPGRYFVSAAFTLACHVIARRAVTDPTLGTTSYMIYLNDGVYGNFSSIMFDHQNPIPELLKIGSRFLYGAPTIRAGCETPNMVEYSIWGPTCDGLDCIAKLATFRDVVETGDWLYFEDMGAYTRCSATRFNGFTDQHEVVYVCSEPGAVALLGM